MAVIAAQQWLQGQAPLDVVIPFAPEMGRALLQAAKVTDPRLTREFPRVAGFTAAHALLCIGRRERTPEGAVVATTEDYEAARGVILELSTTRDFSRFAIEVWNTVNDIHTETAKAVTNEITIVMYSKWAKAIPSKLHAGPARASPSPCRRRASRPSATRT